VQVQQNEQIGDTAAVTVNGSGLLNLGGHNEAIGSLAGPGTIDLRGGTLIVGGNNGSTQFSGTINEPGQVIKVGARTLQLTDNNPSVGSITIDAGTADIGSGQDPNVAVVVNGGGTLRGRGTVGPTTVAAGGTVAPGTDTPGVLTVEGGITFSPGAVLAVRLNGPGAGGGYDRLHVTGPVNLGGPGGTVLRLSVASDFASGQAGPFTLIRNDDGPVQGTLGPAPSGPALTQGALLLHRDSARHLQALEVSYTGGNGNDVQLRPLDRPHLFVRALFADFHVTPNSQRQESFARLGGLPAIAEAFLTSPERRRAYVEFLYGAFGFNDGREQTYLNLLAQGTSPGEVLIRYTTSRLFRARHRRNRDFLRTLLGAVLGGVKPVGQAQFNSWLQGLNQGTLSRAGVVRDLVSSDATYRQAIRENFGVLLNEKPMGADFARYLPLMRHGLTSDALSASLLASDLYLNAFLARCAAGRVEGLVCATI
jgi:hypothetical protein